MAKLLVRGTLENYNNLSNDQKLEYKDSIVFLTDTLQILVDGIFYGMSSESSKELADVIDKVNNLKYFNGITDGSVTATCTTVGALSIVGKEDAIVEVTGDGFEITVSIKEGTADGTFSINGSDVKLTGFDELVDRVSTLETEFDAFKTNVADNKVSSVTSNSYGIAVDNTDPVNPRVGLKIDSETAGNVVLTENESGLRAEVEIPVKNVSEIDKVLTLADNGLLSTTIGLSYTKRTETKAASIILTGKGGVELAAIDATDFVVDGMLSNAELVDANLEGIEGKYLKLTWNVDSGKDPKVMYVPMKDLIDVYTGKNLLLENISVAEADRTEIVNGMSVDLAIGNIKLNFRDLNQTVSDNHQLFEDFKNREEGFATSAQGDKADSAIQEVVSGAGTYITVETTVENNVVTLKPSIVTESMEEAGKDSHGLAETADVKNYINELLSWGTF